MFIFGGTFSPVHLGHLHIIHNVISHYNSRCHLIEKIKIVPAFIPPFKEANKDILPFSLRYKLLELSLSDYSDLYGKNEAGLLELDDIEEKLGKKVCTCDLIKYFKEQNVVQEDDKAHFIAGDDILKDLGKWKDAEYLKKNLEFIIYPRIFDTKSLNDRKKEGFDIEYLDGFVCSISSTDIRKNGNLDYLSSRCRNYIKQNSIALER